MCPRSAQKKVQKHSKTVYTNCLQMLYKRFIKGWLKFDRKVYTKFTKYVSKCFFKIYKLCTTITVKCQLLTSSKCNFFHKHIQ